MQKSAGRILIVDDDPGVVDAAALFLKQRFEFVASITTPSVTERILDTQPGFDAVLLDMNFSKGDNSGQDGLALIDRILNSPSAPSIVCMTAYGDVDLAVKALQKGAVDFVVKPWDNEKLAATMRTAVRLKRSETEADTYRAKTRALSKIGNPAQPLIGNSTGFRRVIELARRVAQSDANIFILGENGVGKDLVAREIHRLSSRSDQPFVTIDLGTIPENMADSELFGTVSGTKQTRMGRIAAANGGTLFLDEIGNASLPLQLKLLTFLERGEITPVGADRAVKTDLRIIAATNLDDEHLHNSDQFRTDLLYRLNTIEIRIPPLRHRRDDIPLLVDHFVRQYAVKHNQPIRTIPFDVATALKSYDWPGNVRALSHAIERATLLAAGEAFSQSDFALHSKDAHHTSSLRLDDIEKTAVAAAMRRHEGNISHVAKELGLTRASLYRRLKKYDL